MSVLLRTEGVDKSFGGVRALDACTIQIDEGTIAGLIGPNGSGKTTLFNVITGYDRADAGEVYLSDKKITNSAPDKVFGFGIGHFTRESSPTGHIDDGLHDGRRW